MFYNNFNNNCQCEDNYYKRKKGCCVKYSHEICCYPSYFNENEYYENGLDFNNDENCNCKKTEKNDCQRRNNHCCFCNRFFRW